MRKEQHPKNHIKQLCSDRNISPHQLAIDIGMSPAQMSRLINRKSGLKTKWITKIADALRVGAHEIRDLPTGEKLIGKCDEVTLNSIMRWLGEESEKHHIALTIPQFSKLTTLIYNETADRDLDHNETQHLVKYTIRAKAMLEQSA